MNKTIKEKLKQFIMEEKEQVQEDKLDSLDYLDDAYFDGVETEILRLEDFFEHELGGEA